MSEREAPFRSRQEAERYGRGAERWAELYLRLKFYRVLARRYKTPVGEIDLIVRRGRVIAFVEVKTRKTAAELDFAVDEHRLARVAAAAEILGPRYCQAGDDMRVDVVLIAPRAKPRHIENAWLGF